jgi:hypothetical protein
LKTIFISKYVMALGAYLTRRKKLQLIGYQAGKTLDSPKKTFLFSVELLTS